MRHFLDDFIKRSGMSVNQIARGTHQSPQLVTNNRHTSDMTPDNAVRDARYFQDYPFSNQAAAVFFETVCLFNSDQWTPEFKNAPYATLDAIKDQWEKVQGLCDPALDTARDKPEDKWNRDERKDSNQMQGDMVKMISLMMLFIWQYAQLSGDDPMALLRDFNRRNEKMGGKRYGRTYD